MEVSCFVMEDKKMIRTTGLKRSAAFFMAVVLTALCFTVFLHSPRVYAEGEDDAKQAQETAQTVIEEYELSGKNVGVQIGTIGEREVYPYEESSRSRVEHFYTSADAVKALTEKQVECIVLDEKTMNALAQENEGLSIVKKPFSEKQYRYVVSKDNKELLDKVNKALKKLTEDKTIESIVNNYTGLDSEKGRTPYKKKDVEREGTITLAVTSATKPNAYIDNGTYAGIDIDVMQAVCDELKTELVVSDMQPDSLVDSITWQMADIAAVDASGVVIKESVKKELSYSSAYADSKQLIAVYAEPQKPEPEESAEESSGEASAEDDAYDFTGKRIGVQLGTTGDIYATDYETDGTAAVERYAKAADAVQALNQQKIDCIILDEQPAKKFVEKNPNITILSKEFTLEDYAMCVKKGNKELLDKVNAALKKLRENGTLQSIIDNYIGTDETVGKTPYKKKDVERNGTLKVATNAEFPPYEFVSNGEFTGIDMDMVQAIADELGMELKIENMKFDSIIASVNAGKADIGAAGMTVTEDRKKNVDFTDSYTTSKQVIIVYDKNSVNTGLSFGEKLKQNFIDEDRWRYLVDGLGTTLLITVLSILVGMLVGTLVAVVRTVHDQNGKLKILNFICNIYLTVIRGTPAVLQLLIIYYGVFGAVNISKIIVAVVAFGLNSGAYVAEVIRSGINAVDKGQFEAGRCLGLDYKQTMSSIIMPQAFKYMLPALLNEVIALLKETAICGYIALQDLTMGGDIIRSQTFDAFLPLIAVAIIYLIIVIILTRIVKILAMQRQLPKQRPKSPQKRKRISRRITAVKRSQAQRARLSSW